MGEVIYLDELLDYSEDELAEVGRFSVLALPGFGSVGHLAHVDIDLLRTALHCHLLCLLPLSFLRSVVLQAQDGVSLPAAACSLLLLGVGHERRVIDRRFNIERHEEIGPIFEITILEPRSSAHCLFITRNYDCERIIRNPFILMIGTKA